MGIHSVQDDHMKWYDPRKEPFKLNGFGWTNNKGQYRRLPEQSLKMEMSDSVNLLANFPTGGQIRFQTNAKKLSINVVLMEKANMYHMSAIGQCGFDCYIGEPTKQLSLNASGYDHYQKEYIFTFFERQVNDIINITLNFPLYQGVESVHIGVNEDASIITPPEYQSKKR